MTLKIVSPHHKCTARYTGSIKICIIAILVGVHVFPFGEMFVLRHAHKALVILSFACAQETTSLLSLWLATLVRERFIPYSLFGN